MENVCTDLAKRIVDLAMIRNEMTMTFFHPNASPAGMHRIFTLSRNMMSPVAHVRMTGYTLKYADAQSCCPTSSVATASVLLRNKAAIAAAVKGGIGTFHTAFWCYTQDDSAQDFPGRDFWASTPLHRRIELYTDESDDDDEQYDYQWNQKNFVELVDDIEALLMNN